MNTNTERLDEVEEIYLTEVEFDKWFSLNNPQPNRLLVEGSPWLLHDWAVPNNSDPCNPSRSSEPHLMAARSGGNPVPEVRKLKRPARAVWTLIRCGCRVIAVKDCGDIALLCVTEPPEGYGRQIKPTDGSIWNGRSSPLVKPIWAMMDDIIRTIQSQVESGDGRRLPSGFSRLFKCLSPSRTIHPSPT